MNILEFLGLDENDIRESVLFNYQYIKKTSILNKVFPNSGVLNNYFLWKSNREVLKQLEIILFMEDYIRWKRFRKQKGFLA